ncbi:MAG: hypothetical protein K0S41_3750 [Anaerocolumna sp.]|nr:hypothetical protein [Anaerocolumna sp.]
MKDITNLSNSDKSFQIWCKCMELGERTGCHQLPERSFFIKGYQMPVCARCTGVILGYIIAIPIYIICGFKMKLSIVGCFVMLMDWFLQQVKIKSSTNKRRLITGILGGFGIMTLQINLIRKIISYL